MNSFLNVKEQKQQERTLVTGVCNSKVLAINPDRETLAEIVGRDAENMKEPSYIGQNRDGEPNVRIDIWLKPINGIKYYDEGTGESKNYIDPYKLAIFLSDKEKSTRDESKNMFINGRIQTTWAKDAEQAQSYTSKAGKTWFSENSIRICKEGEDQLLKFFSTYTNADLMDAETDLVLNDYDAILSGDTSELEAIMNAKNEEGKTVNVLLGVRDGKYQEVYSHEFERGMRKTFARLGNTASGEYNGFKADFQNDTMLKAYVRPVAPVASKIESMTVQK